MRRLAIVNGLNLELGASLELRHLDPGYALIGAGQVRFIAHDAEGAIDLETARSLIALGLGRLEGGGLFERVELVERVLGWDRTEEIAFVADQLATSALDRGLDVGCGWGALLLPLVGRGFMIDGIDESRAAVLSVGRALTAFPGCRVFRASIAEFAAPGDYAYAYAAMNTLRYLESRSTLARHMLMMATSVRPGGLYLVSLSIVGSPAPGPKRTWRVEHDGRTLEVTWALKRFCHLRQRLVEGVSIRDFGSGRVVHAEEQAQGHYTADVLEQAAHPYFALEQTFDARFAHVPRPAVGQEGTFWFRLRRTGRAVTRSLDLD